MIDFKYSHNQDKVEKIVEKMKNESKKMKMEVGKVYRIGEWNGVAICLEYAPDLQFKHAHLFQKQMNKTIDPIDKPYMCLLYDLVYYNRSIAFYDGLFNSSARIPITEQLTDYNFTDMESPWREIVLNIQNKKDEVKKCFRINKDDRSVHCFEGRRKVKWAKDNSSLLLVEMKTLKNNGQFSILTSRHISF